MMMITIAQYPTFHSTRTLEVAHLIQSSIMSLITTTLFTPYVTITAVKKIYKKFMTLKNKLDQVMDKQ